jgi:hypothetical protein
MSTTKDLLLLLKSQFNKSRNIFTLSILLSCTNQLKVPIGSLDPRSYPELYLFEIPSFVCKQVTLNSNFDFRPESFMKKSKECFFKKSSQHDQYILDCEKSLNMSYIYTTKIGSCFEIVASYKRDFTKESK